MKKMLFAVALFIATFSFGQNKQNANWCFGFNAGANFNTVPPTPFLSATPTTPLYNMGSGEASVSDENGVLQFYTDGLTVWNKNHSIMTNGTGLYGFSDLADFQKVVIIPKPNHPKIYYVFTLGLIYRYQFGAPAFGKGGIHYTIVDMTSGLGQVDPLVKNIPLLNHNNVAIDYDMDYSYSSPVHITEHSRMTTSLHNGGDKTWLSFMADYEQFNSGNHQRYFYNYLVTENGIMYGTTGNAVPDGVSPKPTVSTALDNVNYPSNTFTEYRGVMKVSPNGQFLADGEEGSVNLYTYNSFTGNINLTSHQTIYTGSQNNVSGWGLEFSPNSLLVYFSVMGVGVIQDGIAKTNSLSPSSSPNYHTLLYQYSIENKNLQLIYDYPIVSNLNSSDIIRVAPEAGGLQLGLDNRIYVTNHNTDNRDRLGVITLPNAIGIMCGFNPNGLILTPTTLHNGSLPQWVHKAVINYWPKVYYTSYPSLLKDNNGNLFSGLWAMGDLSENINHRGVLPATPNNEIFYTFPYGNSGVTNWTKTNLLPIYVLNSGDVQLAPAIYTPPISATFCNTNGSIIAPPALIQAGDIILAETSTGGFITQNGNSIYLRTNTTTTSIPMTGFVKFNPATNRLYVNDNLGSFKVYDIINNNFVLVSSSPNDTILWIVQISNQDQVIVYNSNGLQQYNYLNNTYSSLNIPGLPSSDVFPTYSYHPYTEDKFLVHISWLNKLYAVDLSTMTARNTYISGGYHVETVYYAFIGNDVYISSCMNWDVTIAGQNIPMLPDHNLQTGFITKLNLLNDFSPFQATNPESKSAERPIPFKVLVSPNPLTGNNLNLKITESEKQSLPGYSISITNRVGRVVLQKTNYLSDTPLNIAEWEKGIYYIEIINRKGERVAKSFVKL